MHDDYGVTYAIYDGERIPQLMRSPGPVSGGTQREMTMARIPEGLAREALEWLADEGNILMVEVDGGQPFFVCAACHANLDKTDHAADCLHTRSAEWLAAEKAAREWRPRAKVVNRD